MSNAICIAAVPVNEKLSESDGDVNVGDTVQIPKTSHSERLLRKQHGMSVIDLFFLRRLRDESVKHRVQCERQDITHFLKKNSQFLQTLNWKNKPFNICNLYHPLNQRPLVNDISSISDELPVILGDLHAKHTSWRCSEINKRDEDLLDFFDDRALLVLNDGTLTHSSFSYNTKETLDIAAATSDINPRCKWSVLRSVGSYHLPVLIDGGR
ncbi:putative RNA-directed DNA polymerase from transposon BS [Trichonephila clavipes]|nr:putative RNA-directed DNA polymerase from transposon BS [Trichonephila clavipes]